MVNAEIKEDMVRHLQRDIAENVMRINCYKILNMIDEIIREYLKR